MKNLNYSSGRASKTEKNTKYTSKETKRNEKSKLLRKIKSITAYNADVNLLTNGAPGRHPYLRLRRTDDAPNHLSLSLSLSLSTYLLYILFSVHCFWEYCI